MRACAGDSGGQSLQGVSGLQGRDAPTKGLKYCCRVRCDIAQVQSAEQAHGKLQHQNPNLPLILQPGRMEFAIAPEYGARGDGTQQLARRRLREIEPGSPESVGIIENSLNQPLA